ncbi:MAG: hypothetical protein DRP54_08705 [Spirochaetes bacterium]|nr:MAG: hypothetical protein DRP54_08705 [Spirochaetota bacterium]
MKGRKMRDKNYVVSRILYNSETCFSETDIKDLKKGDLIVIETDNGPEIARVSGYSKNVPEGITIRKFLRKCTEEDLRKREENLKREKHAFNITLDKIKKHGLDMKLVSVHYFLDDTKILFNFTADERVDFRELVKDLASVFKRRIELRQIGARDEAKIVKGFGICGRTFCCHTIKHQLQPVTIKMAKDQNLTLNSSKISGACGRLLCCLAHEHEIYCQVKNMFPPEGTTFRYDGKMVTLEEINVIKMSAILRTEDSINIEVKLQELEKILKEQNILSRDEACNQPAEAEKDTDEKDIVMEED